MTFEMHIEHQSVNNMNNVDGDFVDNSQHNSNQGDGDVTFHSQYKPCEGSSNEHAGSAVCCASRAGGACCASAAEAGHGASTSTDCPDHLPFAKKYTVRNGPVHPYAIHISVALLWCSLSVVSMAASIRFLSRSRRQGSPDTENIVSAEVEPLCQAQSLEMNSESDFMKKEGGVAEKGCRRQMATKRVVLALLMLSSILATVFFFSRFQANHPIAQTRGITELYEQHIEEQHVQTQNNADTINNYGSAQEVSFKFGRQTLEPQRPYRVVWDMDRIPESDHEYKCLEQLREYQNTRIQGEMEIQEYQSPSGPSKTLILANDLSFEITEWGGDSAHSIEWTLDVGDTEGCLMLVANTNGKCLVAEGSDDIFVKGFLHLDGCNQNRNAQCWILHEGSTKIHSNTAHPRSTVRFSSHAACESTQ